MLAAGPRSLIVFDKTLHAVRKRHGLGLGSLQRCHARALAGDGVDALKAELAGLAGLLARLGKGEHVHGADAHVARAACGDVAVYPLLAAAFGHAQIEASTVAIQTGLLRLLHLERREPMKWPRHCPLSYVLPISAVLSMLADRADKSRRWQLGK